MPYVKVPYQNNLHKPIEPSVEMPSQNIVEYAPKPPTFATHTTSPAELFTGQNTRIYLQTPDLGEEFKRNDILKHINQGQVSPIGSSSANVVSPASQVSPLSPLRTTQSNQAYTSTPQFGSNHFPPSYLPPEPPRRSAPLVPSYPTQNMPVQHPRYPTSAEIKPTPQAPSQLGPGHVGQYQRSGGPLPQPPKLPPRPAATDSVGSGGFRLYSGSSQLNPGSSLPISSQTFQNYPKPDYLSSSERVARPGNVEPPPIPPKVPLQQLQQHNEQFIRNSLTPEQVKSTTNQQQPRAIHQSLRPGDLSVNLSNTKAVQEYTANYRRYMRNSGQF